MHNFKEYFLLNEAKVSTFCYMLYADEPYSTKLKELQKELDLDGELTDKNKFHITIRYVKTNKSPDPLIDYLNAIQLPKLSAVTKNFNIFGEDKCLVMEVDSPEIHKWFKQINKFIIDCGFPDSDYKIYKPHITLTEGTKKEIPKFLNKHKMNLVFKKHVVTGSDYKIIFQKKI